MIDLADKSWAVIGTRGSGKTWLVKSILDTQPSHLVYDPLAEYAGYRRYIPTDRTSPDELTEVVRGMVEPWKPRLFVVEEGNTYCPPKPARLPSGVQDLNDFGRHWRVSTGYCARRCVQFNSDIIELADYLFLFHSSGKNDYRYLEDVRMGLGDIVRSLGRWEFVVYKAADGSMARHLPIGVPAHPA